MKKNALKSLNVIMETSDSKNLSTQEMWEKDAVDISSERPPSHFAIESEEHFPRKAHVLEIGCGPGFDAVHFLAKGHDVTCIDISNVSLGSTREKAKALELENHLSTMQSDLGRDLLLFKDDVFEIMFSRLALHYFTEERTIKVFADIHRVLKKGGKAFIRVKSPRDEAEMRFLDTVSTKLHEGLYEEKGVMRSRYDETVWKSIVEKAEISNVHIRTIREESIDKGASARSGNSSFLLTEIIFTK